MAHVIWKAGEHLSKAALPNKSHLSPREHVAALQDAGALPFPSGTPYIVVNDEHEAARLSANQLSVDFATGSISINPQSAKTPSQADFADAIQAHIDATAASRGYGSSVLLASYVASTVPAWTAEAKAFVAWRDAVWLAAYGVLGSVNAGEAHVPTIAGLLQLLPPIEWPPA